MVQIVVGSQTSLWATLGPFAGSVILFLGAMITLICTNRAAYTRQTRELEAAAKKAKADRASARADQLRVEVAAILAERPTTLDAQRELFDATFQHRMEVEANSPAPAERARKVLAVRQQYMDHSDKLENMVIRALLLTTDPAIEEALTEVRRIAHNWNLPMKAAQSKDDVEQLEALTGEFTKALDDLEAATRKLTAVEADITQTS